MCLQKSLTVSEVAEIEVVSQETVLAWIARGELRAYSASEKAGSKKPRWRIAPASLEAFRQSRQNKPADAGPARRRRSAKPVKQYV